MIYKSGAHGRLSIEGRIDSHPLAGAVSPSGQFCEAKLSYSRLRLELLPLKLPARRKLRQGIVTLFRPYLPHCIFNAIADLFIFHVFFYKKKYGVMRPVSRLLGLIAAALYIWAAKSMCNAHAFTIRPRGGLYTILRSGFPNHSTC